MRLGVLLDRPDAPGGGAEAHTTALLQRALEAGDEVVVAHLEGAVPDGVRAIRVPAPHRRPARDRTFATAGLRALRDAVCDAVLGVRHCPGVDVYLPHGGLVGDAAAAWDAARGGSAALRRLARRASPKARFFLEAERALLGATDGPTVVCVSRALAARMRAVYPASASRQVVVPNGVDAAHFDAVPHREAGRRVRAAHGLEGGYVGLLLARHPRLKGAAVAVAAMAEPPVRDLSPPFRLLVAGGTLDRAVRRLARRLGVRSRVVEAPLAGDVRPLLAAADVLVHPTWYDPCSLACVEALAMSLPVITTPVNGAGELMGSRGGIVLEATGSAEALAVALGTLADPDLRAATGDDARRIAEANPLAERLDAVLDACRGAA